MPYVPPTDRESLEPFIERLATLAADEIIFQIKKNKEDSCVFPRTSMAACFGYIAITILRETSLNSAKQQGEERKLRYKLIAKQSAVVVNVLSELHDRVLALSPTPYNFEVSLSGLHLSDYYHLEFGISPLDLATDDLVYAVTKTMGLDYHNDPDAFMGLCNYSLTELMPRILLKVYAKFQKPFGWNDVLFLLQFWWAFYKKFYAVTARPYENEQIKKNGDVEIYRRMLELLGAAG